MLGMRNLQFVYGCSRLISYRGLRSKARKQPGIEKRLTIATKDTPDIENMKPEDADIEHLEADLMQAEEITDEYFSEIERIHKKHTFKAIERKHFKPEQEPNMLTWAEKEQIRYLHNEDPNQWTEEKLAESFPASPSVIKKVLKAAWKPNSAERIRKHDEQVARNWSAFTTGEIQIHDPNLKQHLNKFTSRRNSLSLPNTVAKRLIGKQLVKPQSSEFSSIISSYNVLKNEQLGQHVTDVTTGGDINISEKQARMYFSDKPVVSKKREKQVQLEQLKAIIKNKLSVKTPEIDREIIRSSVGTGKADNDRYIYTAPSERFDSDAVSIKQTGKQDVIQFSGSMYPDRIEIPKDMYVKGCLYKVKDCFYDDDGEFLYRVPGLY